MSDPTGSQSRHCCATWNHDRDSEERLPLPLTYPPQLPPLVALVAVVARKGCSRNFLPTRTSFSTVFPVVSNSDAITQSCAMFFSANNDRTKLLKILPTASCRLLANGLPLVAGSAGGSDQSHCFHFCSAFETCTTAERVCAAPLMLAQIRTNICTLHAAATEFASYAAPLRFNSLRTNSVRGKSRCFQLSVSAVVLDPSRRLLHKQLQGLQTNSHVRKSQIVRRNPLQQYPKRRPKQHHSDRKRRLLMIASSMCMMIAERERERLMVADLRMPSGRASVQLTFQQPPPSESRYWDASGCSLGRRLQVAGNWLDAGLLLLAQS